MDKLVTLNALYFALIAVAGIVFHVVQKWAKREIDVSVTAWFLGNPQSTVGMLLAVFGSLTLLIANGQANNVDDTMQVIAVFGLGYAFNSTLNRQ